MEPQSNASALKRLLSNGTVASTVRRDGEDRTEKRETMHKIIYTVYIYIYVVCPKSKGTDFPMYELAT